MDYTEIRLDRGYYHLHHEIGDWCVEHFGPVDMFKPADQVRWRRDMMFGYQDYTFARSEDATLFSLRWLGAGR